MAGVLRTLTRDTAGRITGYSHTNNGSAVAALDQTFGYDNLDRLTSRTQGASTTQYTYDATGNRTAQVIGGTTYSNTIASTSNRLTGVQDVAGTATITHDAAGNTTGDGSYTYTYSDRGRMASVTTGSGTVTYKYNGLGQRAQKSGPIALVPTGAGYFVYDEDGQLLGEYDASGAPLYETVYLGSMPVGAIKHTGTAGSNNLAAAIYNVHADHVDTPRVITQQDHNIVWRWDTAEAFGATAPDQNPSALGAFAYHQRFPGQVFDQETGLFQNWNREYNARTGRYVQSDPIGLAGGINTFAYVEGDPLRSTDPRGLATEMCRRKLDKVPFTVGPLFHQYICVPDGKGGKTCGGLGPSGGNPFNSKGKMEYEQSTAGATCETVADDNACIEQCIAKEMQKNPPNYSLDLSKGDNCQSWANAAFAACQAQCRRRQ